MIYLACLGCGGPSQHFPAIAKAPGWPERYGPYVVSGCSQFPACAKEPERFELVTRGHRMADKPARFSPPKCQPMVDGTEAL